MIRGNFEINEREHNILEKGLNTYRQPELPFKEETTKTAAETMKDDWNRKKEDKRLELFLDTETYGEDGSRFRTIGKVDSIEIINATKEEIKVGITTSLTPLELKKLGILSIKVPFK